MVVKYRCNHCGGNLYVDKNRYGGLYYTCYLCAREYDLNFNPLRKSMENFCPDALRLFSIKVLCTGDNQADCPLVSKCPRLILEEAMDKAIPRAINAMIEVNEIKSRKI